MNHRTHLPQPDEALRRTRADQAIRAGLHWIAQRLTTHRPTDHMTDNARRMAATRYAYDLHGDTGAGGALCALLIERMPTHRPDETRGEYALRLRRAAGKANA
ncbi:hypothetical protein ACFVQ4_25050 [Streptomyces laurentii]|uniref:hypothetical protein n=1 Tax=Streptomyces laurentii TaxID=39478 RepID=UPI0036B71794